MGRYSLVGAYRRQPVDAGDYRRAAGRRADIVKTVNLACGGAFEQSPGRYR